MINSLSILIPTYNNVCFELVKNLQAQAAVLSSASEFEYEIIVADDGSTDKTTIEQNREINDLENSRYVERKENVGRAIIRNFLAQEAKHPWLLFIDSNMNVINNQYLAKYQKEQECDVIYGGYQVRRNLKTKKHNLRYIFECKALQTEIINNVKRIHTATFIPPTSSSNAASCCNIR